MIRNFLKATLAVSALTWALASNASAAFKVTISDGTNTEYHENTSAFSENNIDIEIATWEVKIKVDVTDPSSSGYPELILEAMTVKMLNDNTTTLTVTLEATGYTFPDSNVNVNTELYTNMLKESATPAAVTGYSEIDSSSTSPLSIPAPVTSPQSVNNSMDLASGSTIRSILQFSGFTFTSPNDNIAKVSLTTTFGPATTPPPPPAVVPVPATLLGLGTALPLLGVAFRRRSAKPVVA